MPRKSSGGRLWLAIGALVLIAMVPKEIWIAIGVIALIGAAIHVIAKWRSKQHPISGRYEPTLAELIEASKTKPPRMVKLTSDPEEPHTAVAELSRQPPTRTDTSPYGDRAKSDLRLASQPRDWIEARSVIIRSNHQKAEELRRKFPPGEMRPWDQQVQTKPDEKPDNDRADHLDARLDSQSEEWRKKRDSLAYANRQRSEHLRDKLPSDKALPWHIQTRTETKEDGNHISHPSKDIGPEPEALTLGPKDQPDHLDARLDNNSDDLRKQRDALTQEHHELTLAELIDLLTLDTPNPIEPSHEAMAAQSNQSARPSDSEGFYSVTTSAAPQIRARTHSVPHAPDGFGETRWIAPSEFVQVAGLTLPGGMFYFGPRMKAANGETEPALINPQLNVAHAGDFRQHHTQYWPSYSDISPTARRAYLNWLADGRSHPECDLGFVFLFFYGLERRVLIDAQSDPDIKGEWPAIKEELRRLLGAYGEQSDSFRRYARELLNYIELDSASGRLYEQPVPDFSNTYELPPYLRLALGQAAVDRFPLPAELALSWVRLDPGTYLRTAATRCPEEFGRLFAQRYHDVLGKGLLLPKNRTKLKFVYQAASAGFRGVNIKMTYGDIPDVAALTAPIKKLQEIANQCTDELGSYSRLVGKDPSLAWSLEGLLLLPTMLWPVEAQTKLETLTARMGDGRLSLTLQELLTTLGGAKQPLNRDRMRGLARALESAHIGMEPHVLGGARTPNDDDTVVLFAQSDVDASAGSGAEYQTAALTLQLASAMAQADGDFNDREIAHLRAEIEDWAHLTPSERRRLHAHLQWLIAAPPTLAALKMKLEPLPLAARETVAAFMATLAQSDGFVSPDEVKFLQKVYKALGVESKRVFSDVHAAGAGGRNLTSTKHAESKGFRLDADRIAALQEDTARVSALLSKIFTEEVPTPSSAPSPEPEAVELPPSPLGLDEPHSALLRLMLSRSQWTRSELEDAASDLDLMLDGALEQINEAAFDAFDAPLCEGDDPVEVNTELLEKIEA